jgi:AcrR family transcriptional regulator
MFATPPSSKRSRDPQESRRALLKAAAKIFNSEGYFATDSNRIARAAGYAPGTFYTHFADKRAIFLAVYEN